MRAMLSWTVALVATASIAAAHEQSLHKGRATEGTVASVSANGLVLETTSGNQSVTFTDTTKVERGEKTLTKEEIRKGYHVAVFGTKLETGDLVAKEIIIHGEEGSEHEGGPAHHHQ